jgi:hypothetical protein
VELLNSGEWGSLPALTKQPLQKTLNEVKRSISLPVRSELFKVGESARDVVRRWALTRNTGPRSQYYWYCGR